MRACGRSVSAHSLLCAEKGCGLCRCQRRCLCKRGCELVHHPFQPALVVGSG